MGYKSKFKGSTVDERLRKCLNLVPTTYRSLFDLRENSSLVPGRFYRITDYVTTTSQEDTQSAGHQFDVVVLALTNDTLADKAWVCHHEGGTYFQNSQLEAWQIWYCLDNDTSRFGWAVPTSEGGKGVIYRMIDEYGNDVPYDFKNIQFKHPNNITTYPDYYYTFTVILSGVVTDYSLDGTYCYGNTMGSYMYASSEQRINRNVFINTLRGAACHSNTFGNYCYNNTLGNSCSQNTFVRGCKNNTFGNFCSGNTFGDNCYNNTFGNNCTNNTFGNSCYRNTLGYTFSGNTLGNNFSSNTLGNDCTNNTFGNNCYNNTFGDNCSGNTFGDNCYNNTFGNNCSGNTFGDNNIDNTFGYDCSNNTFEGNCSNNTFVNFCRNNKVYAGVVDITLVNTKQATYTQQVQNYQFINGLAGDTIEVERNRQYQTTVAVNSAGDVEQFCIADLV